MRDEDVMDFLITVAPLSEVLAFAVARDDVRQMAREVVHVDWTVPESSVADTQPLPTVRTPTIRPGKYDEPFQR